MEKNTDFKKIYADFLRSHLDIKRPLKVVFDSSNGPAGMIIKEVFKTAKSDVAGLKVGNADNVHIEIINDEIDPEFSAHGPNPLVNGATDDIKNKILEVGADLGIVYDADADRAIFIDDKGEMIKAAFVLKMMFGDMNEPIILDELVYQVMRYIKIMPDEMLVPSKIGMYFIKKILIDKKLIGGGEFSGHYIFRDFYNADSGIFASIMFLNALSRKNFKISEWLKTMPEHNDITTEIRVEGIDIKEVIEKFKQGYGSNANEVSERDGISMQFNDCWVNIRTSNTEPLMRIIMGGPTTTDLNKKTEEIRKYLGV